MLRFSWNLCLDSSWSEFLCTFSVCIHFVCVCVCIGMHVCTQVFVVQPNPVTQKKHLLLCCSFAFQSSFWFVKVLKKFKNVIIFQGACNLSSRSRYLNRQHLKNSFLIGRKCAACGPTESNCVACFFKKKKKRESIFF